MSVSGYTPSTQDVRVAVFKGGMEDADFYRWLAVVRADQIRKDAAIADGRLHPNSKPCGVCKARDAIFSQIGESK